MDTMDMLLNEIESEILKAKKAPFSSGDIVLDRRRMQDLVTRFRNAYPQVVTDAQMVKNQREQIIAEAEAYASKTVAAAKAQAEQMVNETDVMKQAHSDADAMRAEAEENYRKKDYEARALAFRILDSAEKAIKESSGLLNDKKRALIED